MARILSISSLVGRGRVGNSIAVPVLEAMGHEVWPIPTILLSVRPGLGTIAKQEMPAELISQFVETYARDGLLESIDGILSGYLPSVAHVKATATAVNAVKMAGRALYLCDPVLGDGDRGLYIDEAAALAIRDTLWGEAEIATPNLFEFQWLSVYPGADAAALAAELPLKAIAVTSSSEAAEIENLLFGQSQNAEWRGERLPGIPNGTGDLFSALLLGHLLNGLDERAAFLRTCDEVEAVVKASVGQEVLQISELMRR